MRYQNYEDYMRNMMGYYPYMGKDYTYSDVQDGMYDYIEDIPIVQQTQDFTPLYPEIYKLVYPMVCKACNMNSNREYTKELLNEMTEEIYRNFEPEEDNNRIQAQAPLKNGDVRNPNAREPEIKVKETRQKNYLLQDLIKILIIREWSKQQRPPMKPPFNTGGRPPMGPIMPPPRPRYY